MRCQCVETEACESGDCSRGQGWSTEFLTDESSRPAGVWPDVRSRQESDILVMVGGGEVSVMLKMGIPLSNTPNIRAASAQ